LQSHCFRQMFAKIQRIAFVGKCESSEICGKWRRKGLRKTHQLLQSFPHFCHQ
jgi:hypothetical protein